jgi:hypothetical protein
MFCPKCAAVNPEDAQFCQKCGQPLHKGAVVVGTAPPPIYQQPIPQPNNRQGMKCPRCGSVNVNVQAVTEVKSKAKHGCIWWLFIGWWLEPILWIFLTLPRLIVALFGGSKKVVSKTHSEAVCQNCGNRWRV